MALTAFTGKRREGTFTKAVESQTATIPSMGYLGAAAAFMALSAVLKTRDRDNWALFFGQWAAPLLIMGLYNKLVKLHGSD